MTYDEIREVLISEGEKQGMTPHKLWLITGRNQTSFRNWILDNVVPNADNLTLWAGALGYDVKLVKRDGTLAPPTRERIEKLLGVS